MTITTNSENTTKDLEAIFDISFSFNLHINVAVKETGNAIIMNPRQKFVTNVFFM